MVAAYWMKITIGMNSQHVVLEEMDYLYTELYNVRLTFSLLDSRDNFSQPLKRFILFADLSTFRKTLLVYSYLRLIHNA